MKRKRGYVNRKPKRPSVSRAKETVPNVAGLVTEYCLEDLLSEDAAMEAETLAEANMSGPEKQTVNERTEDNVNSLHKTNIAVLGNFSRLAGSIATKPSRGSGSYAKLDSRLETETPRANINMSGCQADLGKQQAVTGMMENFPNALRELIISIITDLSKEAGGLTTKLSRGLGENSISNALFQPQGYRTQQEKSSLLHHDPRYNEQELNAALSVIQKIMKLEAAEPFSIPVDPIALGIPDYFDVIDTPMDFGTICKNLENGLKYMNSADVYKDVQYIWENCCKYNKKGDYILELMKRVKTNFMKYWTAAGLHREQPQGTDVPIFGEGYPHLSLPTEYTMTGSKCRQESPLHPATYKIAPNQLQTHQPLFIHSQAYQPHLNYNEPQPSLQQADVSTSTTGYSHLQLQRKSTMRHSTHSQECPVAPVTDKISPGQVQSHKPSLVDNQPQLSSNQPQPSLQHSDANPGTPGCSHLPPPAEPIFNCSKFKKVSPVMPVTKNLVHQQQDTAGSNQVQNHQLSSNQPQPSPQQGDANIGCLHLPPSTEPILRRSKRNKESPVTPVTQNRVHHQQDKAGSNQVQHHQLSSSQPELSPQQGDANLDSTSMQKKHKVRGPTRCLKLLTSVGRIVVATNEMGQPIGDETPQLTSFLGVLARDGDLAPLTHPSWNQVPDENKEKMWQKVQSKFDIDPISKSWVLMSVATKWRNFKSQLKTKHYDTHATDAERLADRDERVLPDQWSALISQWSSEKWQNMSATNKANRAKQKFFHATGQKSFARIFEEEKAKRPDGKEPSKAELFILTRTRKDGQPVNEAAAAVISQLRERTATLENGSKPQDDIFCEIMGQEGNGSGHLYGLGPSPSYLGARRPTRVDAIKMVSEANAEVHEMKEKLVSMEQTCAQMASQMATMMSRMASKEKSSPDKPISNAVAGTSDAPESLPQLPEHTSTSYRAVRSLADTCKEK